MKLTEQQIEVAVEWWAKQINSLNTRRPGCLATDQEIRNFKRALTVQLKGRNPNVLSCETNPCSELQIACYRSGVLLDRLPWSTTMRFVDGGVLVDSVRYYTESLLPADGEDATTNTSEETDPPQEEVQVMSDEHVPVHRVFLAWEETSPGTFEGTGTLYNKPVRARIWLEITAHSAGWHGLLHADDKTFVLSPCQTLAQAQQQAAPEFVSDFWTAAEQASNHVATWPAWLKEGYSAGTRGKVDPPQEPSNDG